MRADVAEYVEVLVEFGHFLYKARLKSTNLAQLGFCFLAKMFSIAQVQSRHFICDFNTPQHVLFVVEMLKLDENVSYIKWSDSYIYVETKLKKTVTYFVVRYNHLALIRVCQDYVFPQANNVSEFGKPMIKRKGPNSSGKLTLAEKLDSTFRYVLENKKTPENLGDDIAAIINKTDFDKVINVAKSRIRAMEYNITLRPWQQKVLSLLYDQDNRTVLWVFDCEGKSGKTELSRYLKYKLNFQKIPAGMLPFLSNT